MPSTYPENLVRLIAVDDEVICELNTLHFDVLAEVWRLFVRYLHHMVAPKGPSTIIPVTQRSLSTIPRSTPPPKKKQKTNQKQQSGGGLLKFYMFTRPWLAGKTAFVYGKRNSTVVTWDLGYLPNTREFGTTQCRAACRCFIAGWLQYETESNTNLR